MQKSPQKENLLPKSVGNRCEWPSGQNCQTRHNLTDVGGRWLVELIRQLLDLTIHAIFKKPLLPVFIFLNRQNKKKMEWMLDLLGWDTGERPLPSGDMSLKSSFLVPSGSVNVYYNSSSKTPTRQKVIALAVFSSCLITSCFSHLSWEKSFILCINRSHSGVM